MSIAKTKYFPFVMWFFPLLFFAYQFILRLWPGLMMVPIMEQFSIEATSFGVMAAFYYYGYAGMQIPVALLLDRFGAKYIIFIFALICGLATLTFTYTDNFYLAVFSRFLIGAGSAVGFLGVSKVVSQWFSKDQYARMIGFSFTLGLMGAIYGGKPVSLLIEEYSWRNVAIVLAVVSIMIGLGAFLALRSPVSEQNAKLEQFKLVDFAKILASPTIWLLAFANLLMVGSLEGFADVWGVQYLMTAYNIGKSDAAECISWVFYGMLFGGPFLAFCTKKFSNYTIIASCGFVMAAIFTFLLSIHNYDAWLMKSIFFVIGVMCCYQVIVFSAGADLVSSQYLSGAIAFLNCINMLGGSFFHTIIGRTMDMFWDGELSGDSIRLYNLETYKYALSIVPICAVIGALMVCGIGVYQRVQKSKTYS